MEKISKEDARKNRRIMELTSMFAMGIVANSRLYGNEAEVIQKGKRLAIEFLNEFPQELVSEKLFSWDELMKKAEELAASLKLDPLTTRQEIFELLQEIQAGNHDEKE